MMTEVELDESQRQATVLALAHLAVQRPGWEAFLREIAAKLDPEMRMFPDFMVYKASELVEGKG